MHQATMKFGNLNGSSSMKIWMTLSLSFLVAATACRQESSKNAEGTSTDHYVTVAPDDTELPLESTLKSEQLQARLWASEFVSIQLGEDKLPSKIELINNQIRYLNWFDQLSLVSKDQVNESFIYWRKTRSPNYWPNVTVTEFMESQK